MTMRRICIFAFVLLALVSTACAAIRLRVVVLSDAFYVSADGVGSGSCTLRAPCSLAFAAAGAGGIIGAGDTVCLLDNGGQYDDLDGVTVSVSGSSGSPVIFKACSGESPVLDGSYPEFRSLGNSAWQAHNVSGGKNIYKSVNTFTQPGTGDVQGFKQFDGTWYALTVHHSDETDYLEATKQDWVSNTPRYMGYGLSYDNANDDKIYIRLDTPDSTAMLGRTVPSVADPNPANHALYLFPENAVGVTISGNYVTFGEGISVNNYDTGILVSGGNVTIRASIRFGRHGVDIDGTDGAIIDSATIDGAMPSPNNWLAWTDIKGGEFPADHMRKVGVLCNGADNFAIRDSIIARLFDGMICGGQGHDIVVGGSLDDSNTFDNVWDDAWQMLSEYRAEISYNKFYGAGPSHDAAGTGSASPDPGKIYIHHNVIDVTRYPIFYGRKNRPDGFEGVFFPAVFPTHGTPTQYSQPWKLYHNTVINTQAGIIPTFVVDISEFGRAATNHQAQHEVYNNIIILQKILGRDFDSNTGNTIYDGNAYYVPSPPVGTGLWRFIHTSTGDIDGETPVVIDTIAELRATQVLADSQVYYPPGWEASGIDGVNPDLDGNYSPRAPQMGNGAVNLTAKGWPGTSVYESYRGAIQPIPVTSD